jgi:hypothetical protein
VQFIIAWKPFRLLLKREIALSFARIAIAQILSSFFAHRPEKRQFTAQMHGSCT